MGRAVIEPCKWRVTWGDPWGYKKIRDFDDFKSAQDWYEHLLRDYVIYYAAEPEPINIFDLLSEDQGQ
jgi:hypothetical protein